jgi:AraC-like DNA-binding protein
MTEAAGVLEDALRGLRLDGAIFFRSEFTEGWGYESLARQEMIDFLVPGRTRLIMFHIVAAGSCWVAVDDDRHWARKGDVVIIPYGNQHRVGGVEPAELVSIATLFDPPPWDELPVVRYGSGGGRTDIVCGYLHSDDPLFDPTLQALPPVFVVTPPKGPPSKWVEASIEFAMAGESAALADPRMSTRLPELVLIEMLALHLASAPAANHGWIAALRDPVLGPALAAIHTEPERSWTVTDLASVSAVSRSVLDERFRHLLGQSPIRYLTDWRMHVAEGLLSETDLTVGTISRRVGYESEEAFSRAFKRRHGISPGFWRADRGPRS